MPLKYEPFWDEEKIKAKVMDGLKLALHSGASKVNVSGIIEFGDRGDYEADFTIDYCEPKLTIRNGKGRSFENAFCNVLLRTENVKELLQGKRFKFKIPKRDNEDPTHLIMDITMEIPKPNFFTKEDFTQLEKFAGQKYQKEIRGMNISYEHLKETYLKVEYWALSRCF